MRVKRRPASGAEAPAGKGRRSALAGPAAVVGAVMAVFAVLFWTLPAPAQTKPVRTDSVSIAAGESLYNLHCSACHGVGGVGAKGPPLLGVGAAAVDFFLSTGRMPLSSPNEEPVSGPPFFNDNQIANIVAYVNYLDTVHGTPGPGIPIVTPPCDVQTANCPTLSEGNSLFLQNCAQCHDASGAGGMLSHGYVVPSLRQANATQIAEAIRVGPRPMPNFGPGQFTNQQVSSIADYVTYLSRTNNPGGLGIAYFGPVPEGFVAIIFGLGILLLLSRFIGNRG
jgi:ubiquinol-cytochrome c reductase cytochrome c subunit